MIFTQASQTNEHPVVVKSEYIHLIHKNPLPIKIKAYKPRKSSSTNMAKLEKDVISISTDNSVISMDTDNEDIEENIFMTAGAELDLTESCPDIYRCPISKELMTKPVMYVYLSIIIITNLIINITNITNIILALNNNIIT